MRKGISDVVPAAAEGHGDLGGVVRACTAWGCLHHAAVLACTVQGAAGSVQHRQQVGVRIRR
jgi:NAD(P)H-hydrate repair Nnr-like enzyme with NAD(P)H-hydrate dehydratase domain